MKIFDIDGGEWWIGADLESVVTAAMGEYGLTEEDLEVAVEVSDAQLDVLRFGDYDENEQYLGTSRTFREQLAIEIADGGHFPRMFAVDQS